VPPSTPAATYFLFACANDTGKVRESNKRNDCKAAAKAVRVGSSTSPSAAISVSPNMVAFGSELVGQPTASTSVKVSNPGTAPLHVSAVAIAGANASDFSKASDGCTATAVAPGGSCTFGVAFSPGAVGDRSGSVTVTSDAPISGAPTIPLSGHGIAPEIAVSADPVAFGKVTFGKTGNATETVSNPGEAPLHIGTVTIPVAQNVEFLLASGADQCSNSTVAPGSRCTIGLKFMPDLIGPASGTLSIPSDALGNATITPGLSGTGAFVLFGLDPTVIHNTVAFQLQMWTAYFDQDVAPVVQISGNGTSATLISMINRATGKVTAVVPPGLPAGTYDVSVEDPHGDTETLAGALQVTDSTALSLTAVSPAFANTSGPSDHTVKASTSFADGARTYLVPHGSTTTPATEVAAQSVDTSTLRFHVPAGLTAGDYDLIAINPDGTAGILHSALAVNSAAAPIVKSVAPLAIVAATGQAVTLTGTSFAAGDTVTASAEDSSGDPVAAPPVVSSAPSCTGSACTQAATIDATSLSTGDALVIRVTNGDGSYSEYGPIGVENSSLNLPGTVAGPSLQTGRRAPGLVAARNDSGHAFLYAIGGDTGTATGALASAEETPIGTFGELRSAWRSVNPLPAAKTLFGAVAIGRYIYAVGGNNGAGATNTGYRAEVLDPSGAPEITDQVLALAPGATHLAGGTWRYQVSATFDPSNVENPGGESLPSFPATIHIPAAPAVEVTLSWAAVPGATGYQIYRTATADSSATPVLIASTSSPSYTDDGSAAPGTATPLSEGALGNWRTLPSMATKREGPGVTVGYDPNNASQAYIYAAFGRSSPSIANSTYEFLPITIGTDASETVGAWTQGTSATANARWQLAALSVTHTQASVVTAPGDWVYLIGGLTAAGSNDSTVEAGKVAAGGDLGTLASEKPLSISHAGAGASALDNQLYLFGGANAAPSSGVVAATITSPPPTLANSSWNAEGLTLTHGRYLPGSAANGGFTYLAGGQTDVPSAADTSVETVR
jgi:hypothetical protein